MQIPLNPRHAIFTMLAAAVLSAGMMSVSTDALAKHKKEASTPSSSDPCAEPTAFVQDHVAKIRALQAAEGAHPSTVVGLFGSTSHFDQDTNAKISELRHDADGVNDLLLAGGCKTIDIDQQLKGPATASTKNPAHKSSY
jgi:hypothetical protein